MSVGSIESLTPREREILISIAEGDSLAEIAQKLSRSLKTIESHRLSIGRKLNANNRVELAKIAIRAGLISIHDRDEKVAPSLAGRAFAETELYWLEQINECVYNEHGGNYISALCRGVTKVLGKRYCAICIPDPAGQESSRYAVSIAEQGQSLEPFYYHGEGTPAEAATREGACIISGGVQDKYPEDRLLLQMNVQSYIGVRLNRARGQNPGVIAVLHHERVERAEAIARVLRFFVPRTSTELARMAQEEQLQNLRQKVLDTQ